jgi:hypothetical protein
MGFADGCAGRHDSLMCLHVCAGAGAMMV